MVQLYNYNLMNRNIRTQYGEIDYLYWLTLEKERIEKDPERKAEVRTHGELAALFVNTPVKGCECSYCHVRTHRDKKVRETMKGERK